jgi:hypothetical protein
MPLFKRDDDVRVVLSYWLTTTAITFTGTHTPAAPSTAAAGQNPDKYQATVTTGLRADLSASGFSVLVSARSLHDTNVTLNFSDDGRITGGQSDVTGDVGQIIGSLASTVGAVAAVVEDAVPADGAAAGSAPASAAASPDPVSFTFVLDVASLPTQEELQQTNQQTVPPTDKPFGWQAVWNSLGTMVTVNQENTGGLLAVPSGHRLADAQSDRGQASIWYRRSRRVQMSVWKANNAGDLELSQSTNLDVYDRHSYHDYVPMPEGGFFGEKSISVTMNPSGTPSTFTAKFDSALADFFKSLAGVPADISGALTSANSATSAWQVAVPSATAQKISDLTNQKTLLQLEQDVSNLQEGRPVTS